MPHSRQRHIVPQLLKKLSFSPVVTIQGARQTGKSFLAREILPKKCSNFHYTSFDEFLQRDFASRNPDTYLAQYQQNGTLAIDEAQKVPDIFDAIKLSVDQNRIPGKYLLLGSTEFSKLTRIRESLTGRMSRVRLYPMNLAETLELPPNSSKQIGLLAEKSRINRNQFMTYLERGGFPVIFAVRNNGERNSLLQDWLDLTTQRDVLQIPGATILPDLCLQILGAVAKLDEPNTTQISHFLRQDARRVKTHIKILTTLFILNEVMPHRLGTGKPIYYLVDVALAKFLGASFERQIATAFLNEQLSQRSYRDDRTTRITYYRTTKGSVIHFVIERDNAIMPIKILDTEHIDERELMILKAFRAKLLADSNKVSLVALSSNRLSLKKDKIEIYPWEAMA